MLGVIELVYESSQALRRGAIYVGSLAHPHCFIRWLGGLRGLYVVHLVSAFWNDRGLGDVR
jgi:hypothetical protein